eukprot:TRINITY_DN18161_c0_g1_i4.p2 TRINITY_DN18161_c0_g1~~TRINITY_DN18161_c0_g1_i4.p2  ORF type:complete len:138 (+),score=17.65 TRINITY_DN18161_c0_g1_i4:115-528(+)
MIRRPPRSTQGVSSAASDVYKRQVSTQSTWENTNGAIELQRRVQILLAKQLTEFGRIQQYIFGRIMEVIFAKEYSAILKDLLHYLGLWLSKAELMNLSCFHFMIYREKENPAWITCYVTKRGIKLFYLLNILFTFYL